MYGKAKGGGVMGVRKGKLFCDFKGDFSCKIYVLFMYSDGKSAEE